MRGAVVPKIVGVPHSLLYKRLPILLLDEMLRVVLTEQSCRPKEVSRPYAPGLGQAEAIAACGDRFGDSGR